MEELRIACYCGACDWTGDQTELRPVNNLWERVQQGEVVPAGECPSCGALAYDDSPPCPQAFIAEHIRADVTELVARMALPWDVDHVNESMDKDHEAAQNLSAPVLDYEAAARAAGYAVGPHPKGGFAWRAAEYAEADETAIQFSSEAEAWRDCCENGEDNVGVGIKPHEIPIIGQLLLHPNGELAGKLEARGERVERDLGGLIVWARKMPMSRKNNETWTDANRLDRDPVLLAIIETEGR